MGRVRGLGFEVSGLGSKGCRVKGLGIGPLGLGLRVSECRVEGLGLRLFKKGSRVCGSEGKGWRVEGVLFGG